MKIICSNGPKVNESETLFALYKAGMDVIRFNFSHADYENIEHLIRFLREYCPDVTILQDLQGVKLRVSKKYREEIRVESGQKVVFCSEELHDKIADRFHLLIPVDFDGDFSCLHSAEKILMKDATMEFDIVEKNEGMIITNVVRGGMVRARKAINAPGMDRSRLDLTTKDRHDILWGLRQGVDIICLSFVCTSQQIKEMKKFIKKHTDKIPEIWAKIETEEGVKNFVDIRKNVAGIVLGRGDLAPEIGIYNVPKAQNELIKKMRNSKKDFIVATQVLESLVRGSTPTRAEVNDIYRCIADKVTGFMLCAETGIGRNPVLAVKTLKEMIEQYTS